MISTFLARFKTLAEIQEQTTPAGLSHGDSLEPCTPGVDCEDCPNQAVEGITLPLCLVPPGGRARIIHVDEGRRFRRRLAELGLAVGMEVRVVRASRGVGPLILAVCNDSRLAMGWGMANKIRVQVVQGTAVTE